MISSERKQAWKALLAQLVGLPTPSRDVSAINTLQTVLQGNLESLGMEVTRFKDVEYGDHLMACTKAEGTRTLLMGHIDTVHQHSFPDGDWKEVDGRLHGPGVLDMKSGVLIILAALEVLHEEEILHTLPLTIFFNSDEEIGSPGTRKVLPRVLTSVSRALVFEGGRKDNQIVCARNGIRSYHIEIQGVSAHAGNGHAEGRNAISAGATLVQCIESLTNYSRGHTLNVGRVMGGTCCNVVPNHLELDFEMRGPTLDILDESEVKISDSIKSLEVKGFTISNTKTQSISPMPFDDRTLDLAHSYGRSAKACDLHMSPMQEVVRGASNANDISEAGIPCIDGLGPLGSGAHTIDEYIYEESLYKRIEILVHWLRSQLA